MANNFINKLTNKWNEGKFVCIGLDKADFEFSKEIIDATYDLIAAYKPQSAYYEALGARGFELLKKTIEYIQKNHPDIPLIFDAKRADIGPTSTEYTKGIFDLLGFDGVTVNPYLGKEALEPFLERADKEIIILVKTSNPGAGEFQDLKVEGEPLYQIVAKHIAAEWNYNGNCAVVVGATYPEELKKVREIIGDMPILIPGIGAQGGNLEATIENGLNSKKQGIIISSSRSIIFAENPRDAVIDLNTKINQYIQDGK